MAKGPKNGKKPLAKRPSAELAVPDFVDADDRAGFDTVDMQDVMFERLALMQDLSPDVKEGKFQLGDIVRRSTEEVLHSRGGEQLAFGVCYYFKEYVEFGDRDNPSEPMVIKRTTDRSSKLAEESRQWLKKKQSDGKMVRKVQDVHNFIIILEDRLREPMLIGCMKSNSKHGSGLLTMANGLPGPIFAGRYLVFSDEETNRRNQTFQVFKFKHEREKAYLEQDHYEACKELHAILDKTFKEGKLGGQYETEDGASPEGGEGGDGKPDADF